MKTIIYMLIFSLSFSTASCVRKSGRKRIKYSKTREIGNTSTSQVEKTNRNKLNGSEIFSKYNSSVFMIRTSDGQNFYQGSGFFVSALGVAVSNYHVFEGTIIGYEQIKLANNKIYKIENIIAQSKENDFIIFQVKSKGDRFNYIPIENKPPKIGEKVFAIGSPRGLENTFSSGEISQVRGNNLIQISVPIDRGSSGGALINEYGYAIGITTGGYDDSGANLNFAVNINTIKRYLP
ncbi:S1C family serine protease [Bacteroides sp. 224]|uniref:S1C family serine protease n=1 Tax=Bacteroides sp. 224 TaxID=2302936 RepID=UPI0013D3B523|nr:trypsin-like peptidase domain-containing protein [Bacteroides sp. 224]NDV65652.1 serine protease [Bacteroides sp. 224]